MEEKKYQIFISSTFLDLQEEREEIINCILNLGHIPVGMELFNAADENQWTLIKKRIDISDYYVVILSDRYGSVDYDGVGYTEKEYDYAIEQGVPIIGFIRDNNSIQKLDYEKRENLNRTKLDQFKQKLYSRYIQTWSSSAELSRKFVISLTKLIIDRPRRGWVRYSGSTVDNTQSSNLFYTLDDRSENNFTHLIKGATKIHVLARTAVNLLSQYERELVRIVDNGCEVKFMFVGDKSDAVKYIYGSDPQLYFENAKKMKFHLENITKKTGKEIEVKIINHAPTVSILYIEKDNGDSFVIVQFYFLHSRLGRDRPLFKLDKEDKWFLAFKDEFEKLWEGADNWI